MTSMACIESDDTKEPGEEAERPSRVVSSSPSPCLACGHTHGRRRRRGCCITCYRKFQACGVALPVPPPPDLPRWLMDRMTAAQRDKALAYLGELAERAAKP